MLGAPNRPHPGLMPALSELRSVRRHRRWLVPVRCQRLEGTQPGASFHRRREWRASVGLPRRVRVRRACPPVRHGSRVRRFPVRLQPGHQRRDAVHASGGPSRPQPSPRGSARSVVWPSTEPHLYVADVGADTVSVYDGTGAKLGTLDVKRPVHLLFDAGGWLWIGSERGKVAAGAATPPGAHGDDDHHDAVYAYDTAEVRSETSSKWSTARALALDHTAGLCLVAGPTTKTCHAPRGQPRRSPHPRLPDRPLAPLAVVEPIGPRRRCWAATCCWTIPSSSPSPCRPEADRLIWSLCVSTADRSHPHSRYRECG